MIQNPHQLPHIEVPTGAMDLDDLMDVTARLADILDEETKYLRTMEVDALAKLHEKKMELTLTLETYQRALKAKPDMLSGADADKIAEFASLAEDFTLVVEENFRRTAVARAVNQRVVNTIVEVMSENNRPGTYTRHGGSSLASDMSISFNLNQKA